MSPQGKPGRREREIPVDLLGGLVMLGIALFFWLSSGEGRLDWLFPRVLSAVLAIFGVVLIVRGLTGFGGRLPAVPPIARGQGAGVDIAVFLVLIVGYVALTPVVGFWPASGVMVFVAAAYLDTSLSARRLVLAAAAALTVCIVGFLLLTRVFFIPFPPVPWLPG